MIKKKPVRELLGESLAELLKSKPYEKITVQEITDNCGVGRRTFYHNFIDKHDLATWMYVRQLESFAGCRESLRLKEFIKYSAEIVSKDLQIIIAVDKYKGQNNLRDSLIQPMTDLYVDVIEKSFSLKVDPEMRRDIDFFVGGQIAYVARVITDPVVPAPDEVTAFFIRCIPESLREFV